MAEGINRIVIHYGELGLKGRNRRSFERALRDNIQHRLRRSGVDWPVRIGHRRLMVEIPWQQADALDTVTGILAQTAGIANFAPAAHLPAGEEDRVAQAERAVVAMAAPLADPQACFAVRINRADKRVPMRSDAMARRIGAAIREHTVWDRVDLSHPDRVFHVDLYEEGTYCYVERFAGLGGLPVGSAGRVLSLLSGGIDSPVAAFLMAKRGCNVDFLHVTATESQQQADPGHVVAETVRWLSRYTLRSRLYMVPYTRFDLSLMGEHSGSDLVLFRRFVARLGQRLAERIDASALVSGDSLGQVASQTLDNMVSTSRAVEIPLLRPLVGMDKHEIVGLARRIGTYELSIQPYKDCCAILDQHPKTRTLHERLTRMEQRLFGNDDTLVDATLADSVCLEFDSGERVS